MLRGQENQIIKNNFSALFSIEFSIAIGQLKYHHCCLKRSLIYKKIMKVFYILILAKPFPFLP
jgi:hypothetical protein